MLVWIASAYAYIGQFLWRLDVLEGPYIALGDMRIGLGGVAFVALTALLFSVMWKAERKGRQAPDLAGQPVGALG
jgi:hypothetical protein